MSVVEFIASVAVGVGIAAVGVLVCYIRVIENHLDAHCRKGDDRILWTNQPSQFVKKLDRKEGVRR